MKKTVEQMATSLGADLVGIAPVSRFADAPPGFHPTDIYARTESIIVVAVQVPSEPLFARSPIPYTYLNRLCVQKVDLLVYDLAKQLEQQKIRTVPLPSDDPSEYWEAENEHAKGVLSMRHAGVLSGLGKLGKNSLLINDRFGSMIQMGALLTPEVIDPSPLAEYEVCAPDCRACINACPEDAIHNQSVIQKRCRRASSVPTERGFVIKKCFECRKKCPHVRGIRSQ